MGLSAAERARFVRFSTENLRFGRDPWLLRLNYARNDALQLDHDFNEVVPCAPLIAAVHFAFWRLPQH